VRHWVCFCPKVHLSFQAAEIIGSVTLKGNASRYKPWPLLLTFLRDGSLQWPAFNKPHNGQICAILTVAHMGQYKTTAKQNCNLLWGSMFGVVIQCHCCVYLWTVDPKRCIHWWGRNNTWPTTSFGGLFLPFLQFFSLKLKSLFRGLYQYSLYGGSVPWDQMLPCVGAS
jgi:hypothetical protein